MATDTKPRMVLSAMQLIREHGYNGTGLRHVVDHAEAPRGSISHHFPGGKAQLGVDAVALAGAFVNAAFEQALIGKDPVAGFEVFLGWWIEFLAADDFRAGCPVLAVAAEHHPEAPQLAAAATAVFELWEGTLARALQGGGVDQVEAADLAVLVVAAVEGAMVRCRAARSRQPLVRVGAQLSKVLRAAVPVA